jgi:hypothetical protein
MKNSSTPTMAFSGSVLVASYFIWQLMLVNDKDVLGKWMYLFF